MPDAAPGQIRPESGWPGHWETITREISYARERGTPVTYLEPAGEDASDA